MTEDELKAHLSELGGQSFGHQLAFIALVQLMERKGLLTRHQVADEVTRMADILQRMMNRKSSHSPVDVAAKREMIQIAEILTDERTSHLTVIDGGKDDA